MPLFTSILCATDGSNLARRVVRHAVALAAVMGARVTIVSYVSHDARGVEAAIAADVAALPLPQRAPDAVAIKVSTLAIGQPVDAILNAAQQQGHDLIVIGTHSKSGISRWLLGSTSAALLEQAPCPTLLVPPGDLDIVATGADGAKLVPGCVLAALDLDEPNDQQLVLAARLADLARQPLVLMNVATPAKTDDAVRAGVLARAVQAGISGRVARTVVARGEVASEIDRVAMAEHAGLVVMGLSRPDVRVPGAIADAVLKARDALVLAVPAHAAAAPSATL